MLIFYHSSAWETSRDEPDEVGARMAEFAMGSIATMAYTNPRIKAYGAVPYLGSRIRVHWHYLNPLLVGIGAVHVLLVIGSILLSRHTTRSDERRRDSAGVELSRYENYRASS